MVERFLASEVAAPCPLAWQKQEADFKLYLHSAESFTLDDRDPQKLWGVKSLEFASHLLHSLACDTSTWRFRPDISREAALVSYYTRAFMGLPTWLRARSYTKKTNLPVMFGFVQ